MTTIHGFSSQRILPVFKAYEDRVHYVAISDADRHSDLRYAATIHHGIRLEDFPFDPHGSEDLLFFGRIHPDKGALIAGPWFAYFLDVSRPGPLRTRKALADHFRIRLPAMLSTTAAISSAMTLNVEAA